MAVTARESSNGRSPGAAMIASTRAPSAARRTIAFSFSAHSPRSASAACAASMAALASSPAHETTSSRAAAVSAIASEKPALRRQRAGGAACRSVVGAPIAPAGLHDGEREPQLRRHSVRGERGGLAQEASRFVERAQRARLRGGGREVGQSALLLLGQQKVARHLGDLMAGALGEDVRQPGVEAARRAGSTSA